MLNVFLADFFFNSFSQIKVGRMDAFLLFHLKVSSGVLLNNFCQLQNTLLFKLFALKTFLGNFMENFCGTVRNVKFMT